LYHWFLSLDEGTGTRPNYLVNRADQKIQGPLGDFFLRKSRNSRWVSGGGVGAEGMVIKRENWRCTGTKYKRSRIVFAVTSIALSLGHLGARLLELAAQSLKGSFGTLHWTHSIFEKHILLDIKLFVGNQSAISPFLGGIRTYIYKCIYIYTHMYMFVCIRVYKHMYTFQITWHIYTRHTPHPFSPMSVFLCFDMWKLVSDVPTSHWCNNVCTFVHICIYIFTCMYVCILTEIVSGVLHPAGM